jgi:hypothetical protein
MVLQPFIGPWPHFKFPESIYNYIWLWVLRDSEQTHPLVREGPLHEEASTCLTKEHVKSGHGPQRAARHQDILAD